MKGKSLQGILLLQYQGGPGKKEKITKENCSLSGWNGSLNRITWVVAIPEFLNVETLLHHQDMHTSQGGDSEISYIVVNLQPQGIGQVEINNCKSIIIDKSIKPVIMADAGYNFPSSVHIQPFNGELILVVANHTKEPDKRRH